MLNEDQQQDSPMRGLIYNEVEDRPKPRTLIHNAGYREDGARNFLNSNNVAYSRV